MQPEKILLKTKYHDGARLILHETNRDYVYHYQREDDQTLHVGHYFPKFDAMAMRKAKRAFYETATARGYQLDKD